MTKVQELNKAIKQERESIYNLYLVYNENSKDFKVKHLQIEERITELTAMREKALNQRKNK